MLRAKQLGAVTFDYVNTLFIQEQYIKSEVMGEGLMSASGTHIAYEAQIHTPYITLDSKEFGLIDEDRRDALMTRWNTLGTEYLLTYDDDSVVSVRMAREKAISFTPLFEGSCEFKAVIPLAKV